MKSRFTCPRGKLIPIEWKTNRNENCEEGSQWRARQHAHSVNLTVSGKAVRSAHIKPSLFKKNLASDEAELHDLYTAVAHAGGLRLVNQPDAR